MDWVWEAGFAAVVACTLAASSRIAVVGLGRQPRSPALRLVSGDLWAIALFIFGPWVIGAFARWELSPLPWVTFSYFRASNGLLDGLIQAAIILLVDLWLVWIPGHVYVTRRTDLDRRTVVLVRSLNAAVGFMLMSPHNPFYRLIEWLGRHLRE